MGCCNEKPAPPAGGTAPQRPYNAASRRVSGVRSDGLGRVYNGAASKDGESPGRVYPPAGMNRAAFDRICGWLDDAEARGDGDSWAPEAKVAVEPAGHEEPLTAHMLAQLPTFVPAPTEAPKPLKAAVRQYDNLVVQESFDRHLKRPAAEPDPHSPLYAPTTFTCDSSLNVIDPRPSTTPRGRVKPHSVVEALSDAAHHSGNPRGYFVAVLNCYVGQDPTALESIHALLAHLEKDREWWCREEDPFHKTHRRVGLVAELYLHKNGVNAVHIKDAVGGLPTLGHPSKARNDSQLTSSVRRGHDSSMNTVPPSSMHNAPSLSQRANPPTVGSPLPVNSPLARDPEGVTWEKRILRGNTTWAPFHLTDKVGPSFHDIGCEIQGKRNGAIIYAPQTVRMSDKLTLELVKGIINQQLKFVCKDGQVIVLKPAEFLLMSGETVNMYDPNTVTLSPDPHSDTGFHVTVAGETRALSFPSSFVRNVLLLLFEVFASLCGENADAYMGLTWMSEYPTGNKQANARLFQAAMNHPTPVVTPEFRLLAAVKYEWANNPSHLMKKLCTLVSIPDITSLL